jgi:tRNA(fMet)-specific endonuclease VapC
VNRYLLDTNHLSAYLDHHAALRPRIEAGLRNGDRFGICLSLLCEYRAGIRVSRRYKQNLARLQAALALFRLWPTDEETAVEFADIFRELRLAGAMLSQFDLLIAAVARRHNLVLLTADSDFRPVDRLQTENWL